MTKRTARSRRTLSWLVPCAFALSAPAGAQVPASPARIARLVDSVAAAAMRATRTPGLVVVVRRGDTTVVARGYGVANVDARTPETARTVHQIGSISKQFAAAAVMRLVERRAIALDDPVSRHLPEYRPQGDAVRVRHLLHQTSGIREEFTLPRYGAGISDTTRPNAELMALIEREPLGFAPGARWSYSNSNYALLAKLIERVTGEPYERVLARELFEPLGLRSMHHCAPLPAAAHHARGYTVERGRVVPAPPENMHWIRGDGGLCASGEDLARWARALATGRAVSVDSYRRMTASARLADGTTPPYGFGLSLVPLDGRHRRVSHGGRMAGFTSTLAYYPDHDVTIVVLANLGGLWIESIEQAIARGVLGVPRPLVRDRPLGAADRRAYVGAYDVGVTGVRVRVVDRGGRLWLEWPSPGPTVRLLHQGGGAFVAAEQPDAIGVTFDRTGAGTATILMAGMHWFGKRVLSEAR